MIFIRKNYAKMPTDKLEEELKVEEAHLEKCNKEFNDISSLHAKKGHHSRFFIDNSISSHHSAGIMNGASVNHVGANISRDIARTERKIKNIKKELSKRKLTAAIEEAIENQSQMQ